MFTILNSSQTLVNKIVDNKNIHLNFLKIYYTSN